MNMMVVECERVDGETEVARENVLTYIHSEISGSEEAKTNEQITQVYNLHRPLNYDIYLDLSTGEWLARGEAMELSADDIHVLFVMITEGLSCTSQMIFKARYNQELEPGNKKDRGRLNSYYRRLKERLKLYGITTEHYTVKFGTRYFVVYPAQKVDEIEKR